MNLNGGKNLRVGFSNFIFFLFFFFHFVVRRFSLKTESKVEFWGLFIGGCFVLEQTPGGIILDNRFLIFSFFQTLGI